MKIEPISKKNKNLSMLLSKPQNATRIIMKKTVKVITLRETVKEFVEMIRWLEKQNHVTNLSFYIHMKAYAISIKVKRSNLKGRNNV